MRELPADFARQLLKDARLPAPDVDERLRRACDTAYWRQLAPGLHVESDLRSLEHDAVSAAALAGAARALHDEGVFHLRGAVASRAIQRLNDAIDRVVAAGWPAVFAFAYDELWLCARTSSIGRLATDVLGDGAAQIPHVWTHIVPPAAGAAGWRPHVDGAIGPRRLSCWLALTDATLDNGCMHVVPRHLAPPRFAERLDEGAPFDATDLTSALQAVTAIPAAAGDVLGWTFDVVHWGGRARSGQRERRSLSFEYIAANETPYDDERPTLPLTDGLPPLAARLHAIAAGVLEYRKFEPLLTRFEDLATRVLSSQF